MLEYQQKTGNASERATELSCAQHVQHVQLRPYTYTPSIFSPGTPRCVYVTASLLAWLSSLAWHVPGASSHLYTCSPASIVPSRCVPASMHLLAKLENL